MIVLDTNVISEFFRPHPDGNVIRWLQNLQEPAAITSVTLAELLAGVERLPEGRRKAELSNAISAAVAPYRSTRAVLPFSEEAAPRYAEILHRRERAGLPIATADAQIGAICLVNQATLATRNTKDFVATGVQVLNPWEARQV